MKANPKLPPALAEALGGGTPDPGALLDALAPALPLIGRMAETPQEPEWHGEGDVRTHTEMVIAEAIRLAADHGLSGERRAALIIGAALHDIGKPLVTREESADGRTRITSPRHAARGRSYAAPRLPALGLPLAVEGAALSAIKRHSPSGKAFRKDYPLRNPRPARCADPALIYLLETADLRGRICADLPKKLERLEYFRLAAEDAGVWDRDPYADWAARLADLLAGEPASAHAYALAEAIRMHEAGEIESPEEAAAITHARRAKAPRFTLTCGTSGSGKSTWVRDHAADAEVVSMDAWREKLGGRRGNQSENGRVFQAAREQLKAALRGGRDAIWDATSLRADGRGALVALAHAYGATSTIVAFPSAPDEARRRNRTRRDPVPQSILDRQFETLEWPEITEAHRVESYRP
ncbi:MAG: AAA family ATPase [Verrucomicrobiales bacterium]